MSSHEPTSGASSNSNSRSASGQLSSNGAGNRLTGQIPTQYPTSTTRQLPGPMSALLSGQPLLGTQPLPALSSAAGNSFNSFARTTSNAAPAHSPTGSHATYGSPVGAGGAAAGNAGGGYASYGTGDYGVAGASGPSPSTLVGAGSTAAYGSTTLTGGYGQTGGSGSPSTAPSLQTLAAATTPAYAYSATDPAASVETPPGGTATGAAYGSPGYGASYAPSGGAAPLPRATQMYGQPVTNSAWQPALPVSPWNTPAAPVTAGGSLDSTAVLTAQLKAVKWSRFRARFYLLVVLGLAGTAVYYELQERKNLVNLREKAVADFATLRDVHEKTLARLNARTTDAPPIATARAAAPGAGAASAGTLKLAEELKRTLVGAPFAVETRGDRIVVGIDTLALFPGKEAEVGLGGYRTLYRFGKALKTVKDRKVAITVPSVEIKKMKAWNLAAGRAVSLGSFFTNDLGFEAGRVTVTAPAPRASRAATLKTSPGRIEFTLEPI